MRPVRLVAIAFVGAALTACSSDITAPARNVPTAPSLNESCRSGFMVSSGRCSDAAASTEATKVPVRGSPTLTTTDDGCRTGYMVSSGRCSTDEE